MFGKVERSSESGTGGSVMSRPNDRPSVISSDLQVVGDLKSSGDVQIDGRVKGDVRSRTVVVSQGADIEGSIFARSVQISGRVEGQIEAPEVSILRSAEVLGDILHETLEIESGARFQGQAGGLNRRTSSTPGQLKSIASASFRAMASESSLNRSSMRVPFCQTGSADNVPRREQEICTESLQTTGRRTLTVAPTALTLTMTQSTVRPSIVSTADQRTVLPAGLTGASPNCRND